MTLNEIEQAIQARLDHMAKMDNYNTDAWLEAYRTLAAVKQAIAAERIVSILDNFLLNGVPVAEV